MNMLKQGLTLIEVIIVMAIISVLTAVITLNYSTFTSRSVLGTVMFNIVEFITLAQSISSAAATENTLIGAVDKKDFESVRIRVRNEFLHDVRIEHFFATDECSDDPEEDGETNNTCKYTYDESLQQLKYTKNLKDTGEYFWENGKIKDIFKKNYESNNIKIKSCLLVPMPPGRTEERTTPPITFNGVTINTCFLNTPDEKPELPNTNIANGYYDIHVAIEHPTQELLVSLLPLKRRSGATCSSVLLVDKISAYCYDHGDTGSALRNFFTKLTPTYPRFLGIRVFLIGEESDNFRYFDIIESGLVAIDNLNS